MGGGKRALADTIPQGRTCNAPELSRREKQTLSNKRRRADPVVAKKQREANRELQRKLRDDPKYRDPEREKDASSKLLKRRADKAAGSVLPKRKKTDGPHTAFEGPSRRQISINSMDYLIRTYESEIRQGPTWICSCCGGLWYKKSIRKIVQGVTLPNVKPDILEIALTIPQQGCYHHLSNAGTSDLSKVPPCYHLCFTCFDNVKLNKTPRLALKNGFALPEIPPILQKLTYLEERFVSPRLPFMQIRTLGRDKQLGLRKNIVNVPNNINECVNVLPRTSDETATIEVMLMRRQCYDKPYLHERVRPSVIRKAAKYLVETPVYRDENVLYNADWSQPTEEMQSHNHVTDPSLNLEESEESDDEINPTEMETMMMESDETLRNMALRFAPCEGNKPISLSTDTDSDIKTFPKIYGGQPRKFTQDLNVSYADIAKSESRMYDRRAAGPTKLLYTCKKLQIHFVTHAVSVCMRKKALNQRYTAGQLCKAKTLKNLVDHDEGYRCLREVRNSPAYLELQQKDLMAMMRQFGVPAFFITFSAAETKWTELHVLLKKILHNVDITEEEAANLPYADIAGMIRDDPITCARNFDNRYRSMLNNLLNKPGGVFSALHCLTDYYQRVEFQKRGSPHSHGLYWLENTPTYKEGDPEAIKKCTDFIDKFVTCKRPTEEDDPMFKYVQYQIHKHNRTCYVKRKGKKCCRFNYPMPPMDATKILKPLSKATDPHAVNVAKDDYKIIKERLEEMGRSYTAEIPLPEFIDSLGLTYERYENAIRYDIKRTTVFLKRSTNAIYVNAYNEIILRTWRANMDIQFVIDQYACAKYCANYINKSCGGVSKALLDVRKEINSGNETLASSLRKYGNAFLNTTEISAQEAAYFVLGMPLSLRSRECVFINTGPANERVIYLKPQEELEKLPENSTEISKPGLIEHYQNRKEEIENVCLADFAAWYVDHRDLKKRLSARTIRYRRYNREIDPFLYKREQLMLYIPWRSEDWLDIDTEAKYTENHERIKETQKLYVHSTVDENFEAIATELFLDDDEEDLDNPRNYGLHIEDLEVDELGETEYIKAPKRPSVEYITPPNQIEDEIYLQMLRSLNEKQWKYFLHLVHNYKTGKTPFHEFVSGGAGVGKSHLITVIVQTLMRMFSKTTDWSPEDVFLLVCASTGKAAYNIHGITVYSALSIPIGRGEMSRLNDNMCNTLRLKLAKLKLIIVDEISMTTLKCFRQIDQRLQQIFQNDEPFGNIPIMVVGDFRQIRPIGGQFVFENPHDDIISSILQNPLWRLFYMFELTQIMRQLGDIPFVNALNRMGDGEMTEEDIKLIRSRTVDENTEIPRNAIRLFNTNKECEEYNNSVHNLLDTPSAVFEAKDIVEGSSTTSTQTILDRLKLKSHTETENLPAVLNLKVGAVYMISVNIDVKDGLFNGAPGTLEHIEYGKINGERAPTRIYLRFEDKLTGVDARRVYKKWMSDRNIDADLTPVMLATRTLTKESSPGARITRTQFPVIAANGITICKAQGSSFRNVVLSLKRNLRRDLLYVGCTRCFSIDGLFLEGEFTPPPELPALIKTEMGRLRETPLQLSLRFLCDVPDTNYKLIFHNVQSMRKHHESLAAEISFRAADVICLVEPRTLSGENYKLKGFKCVQQVDCIRTRNSYGSLTYVKRRTQTDGVDFTSYTSGTGHFDITELILGKTKIIAIYRSPNSKKKTFIKFMENILKDLQRKATIIVGDINIDMSVTSKSTTKISEMLTKYNFRNTISGHTPTTDLNTAIDVCFTNIASLDAWVYESLFSYHKPICVSWKKDPDEQ